MLPSELTNTVTNTIEQINRLRSSEWSTLYIFAGPIYYHANVFEADNIYENPPQNVISPIFFCYYDFALALHPWLCWLLERSQSSKTSSCPRQLQTCASLMHGRVPANNDPGYAGPATTYMNEQNYASGSQLVSSWYIPTTIRASQMTGDVHLPDLIRTMLENRRFFVVLNGKKSRWRRQRNGLPQGSVLAPMLFNIYTNDQPVHADTRSFIYADDLCIASQGNDFSNIEVSLTSALITMTTYYDTNQLRANPSKTQVCAFHLRNREAKRELNVMWNGTRLSNTTTPVYLGVHLDRTRCYKTHIEKTKMKVNARNNIIRKLANSKWGWVQGIDTQTQLSRPLLLSCRIRLPCVGKVCTRAQAEPGSTRLLPNHLGLPQTNELRQCTLAGWHRSSTHQEVCCLPHGTHTPTNRRQTSTIPSPTSCK